MSCYLNLRAVGLLTSFLSVRWAVVVVGAVRVCLLSLTVQSFCCPVNDCVLLLAMNKVVKAIHYLLQECEKDDAKVKVKQ